MKRFACPVCANEVYFESLRCLRCGTDLAYRPAAAAPVPLGAACGNRDAIGCNWEGPGGGGLCLACGFTETIPDLSVEGNRERWARIEEAKRRLLYSLLRLGLPLETKAGARLAFRLLGDEIQADGSVGRRVLTGHDDGVVTLNIQEADDDKREAARVAMGEPFRTLLGHFRHEVGHFYNDALVEERGLHDAFVRLFGDPGQDYAAALKRHYDEGAPPGWQERFVSAYATTHPWEDFAETFAHWMHMTDGLETGAAYGIAPGAEPYGAGSAEALVAAFVPVALAMNAMSRSLGQRDFYPFVVAPAVVAKIAFVHDAAHAGGS